MATSKKDMRRADLIIPYTEPEKDPNQQDLGSTLSSTMPMMAMFTRNKMIGWVSMVFAIQQWLAETPESRKSTQTPAYFGVFMSLLGLATSYAQLFLPPTPPKAGTSTGAQAPQPPA